MRFNNPYIRKKVSAALIAVTFATASQAHQNEFEKTGDILQFGVPLGALFYTIAKGDNEGGRLLLEHCAKTSVVVEVMKKTFNSTEIGIRPHGGYNNFPSGHASGAYCGASYLHARYGLAHAIPAYILATAVGMSRIDANKHTPLAVGASFFVNHAIAREIVGKDKLDKPSNLMVFPYVITKNQNNHQDIKYGIQVQYKF